MRGSTVFHTSLCLLESASETAWASMDTYPCLCFRIVSKAVEIIKYWLPGHFGISGLPRWTGREKLAFVCQEFSLPESTHWQKLLHFLSALVSRHRNKKAGLSGIVTNCALLFLRAVLVVCLEIMKLAVCFYLSPISLHFQQSGAD